MGKWSDAARTRASERMRRQWSDLAVRQRRLSAMARKDSRIHMSAANNRRRNLDDSAVLQMRQQGLTNEAIAERLGVSVRAIYRALRRTRRPGERLTTSQALAQVRRRIARREAKQASQAPSVIEPREPARLWNLSRDSNVTRATEPPPLPKIRGWQKFLCGRLA